MKQQLTFRSDDQAPFVRQRVIRYLESAGYRTASTDGALVFRRGSLLAGFFTFSPKKWKSVVTARVTTASDGATLATLDYDINTTGQTITAGEAAFWDNEAKGLQRAVEDGVFDPLEQGKAERAAVSGNWRFMGALLLGGLVGLVIAIPFMLVVFALVRTAGVPLMRWIFRLVPVMGADAVSALLAAAILGLFAVYVLFQPEGGWSEWLVKHLPRHSPKGIVSVVHVTGDLVLAAPLLALFPVVMVVLSKVKSGHEVMWLGVVIVGMFVVGVIDEFRKKKQKK